MDSIILNLDIFAKDIHAIWLNPQRAIVISNIKIQLQNPLFGSSFFLCITLIMPYT